MTTNVKGDFTPVNGLEEQLRRVLTDQHTPLWDFYTPLSAAPLWIMVPHHVVVEETAEVVLQGWNPAVCVFRGKTLAGESASWLALHSARCRAEAARRHPERRTSSCGWPGRHRRKVEAARRRRGLRTSRSCWD